MLGVCGFNLLYFNIYFNTIFFYAQLEIYDGDTTEGLYSLVYFEITQLGVTLQA